MQQLVTVMTFLGLLIPPSVTCLLVHLLVCIMLSSSTLDYVYKCLFLYFLKSDWINVTDYGATGDGVTDDTAAIMAALNVQVNQVVVWFPKGL